MSGGEGQRERETQHRKQAPSSELSAPSPMKGSNSWAVRWWPEPESDVQLTEPPRRPRVDTFLLLKLPSYDILGLQPKLTNMYAHTTFCLFIHLLVDCFYLSVIVNNAAVNTGMQISDTNLHIWVPAFDSLACMPRHRTAGAYGKSYLMSWNLTVWIFVVSVRTHSERETEREREREREREAGSVGSMMSQ